MVYGCSMSYYCCGVFQVESPLLWQCAWRAGCTFIANWQKSLNLFGGQSLLKLYVCHWYYNCCSKPDWCTPRLETATSEFVKCLCCHKPWKLFLSFFPGRNSGLSDKCCLNILHCFNIPAFCYQFFASTLPFLQHPSVTDAPPQYQAHAVAWNYCLSSIKWVYKINLF